MAGMPEGPGFDPEQMQQAADMMASMSQEALEQMTCMAASHSTGIEQQQPQTLQVQPSGSQQALDAVQVLPLPHEADLLPIRCFIFCSALNYQSHARNGPRPDAKPKPHPHCTILCRARFGLPDYRYRCRQTQTS